MIHNASLWALQQITSAEYTNRNIDIRNRILSAIPTSGHKPGTRPDHEGWFEYWRNDHWEPVHVVDEEVGYWVERNENWLGMWVADSIEEYWGNEIMMPTERPEV